MIEDELIYWEEGLFVQPQHFQTQQRQNLRRVLAERRLLAPFPYGVVRAEVDEAALAKQGGAEIIFTTLHVVLKNGQVVHKDVNATVGKFDFSKNRGGQKYTVYVAVRTYQRGIPTIRERNPNDPPNANKDDRAIYTVERRPDIPDEKSGVDGTEVATLKIAAHLFVVGPADKIPDDGEWEFLPIMQILATDPPQIDRHYAPPCFRLSGSMDLLKLVRDIERTLAASRSLIAEKVQNQPAALVRSEVSVLFKFQAMTTYGGILSHALKDESLTAYDAYGICLSCLGDLSGSEFSKPPVVSEYNHDDPWPPFARLADRIRREVPEDTGPPARFYDLVEAGPSNLDVYQCEPNLTLVRDGWKCVMAVSSANPQELDRVLDKRNIGVGSPLGLKFVEPRLLIPWLESSGEMLDTIHPDGGKTRFLNLNINLTSEAWRRIVDERAVAVKYADVYATNRATLRFRLYLKPPATPLAPTGGV